VVNYYTKPDFLVNIIAAATTAARDVRTRSKIPGSTYHWLLLLVLIAIMKIK